MKIFIHAKPGSKKELVEKISPNTFTVFVKARPEKGLANEAVIKIVAEYLGVAKSRVRIMAGQTSQKKILEVL
ncbi:MAG: DUF167 domain-containing protein [bacterium]|nr:DUF167 domain-containing protein [bacterium]